MAEVDVNFNVSAPGAEKAAANIREVDLEIKKTSKSTSELTDEFGIQNTMLGKIWKSFKDGIKVIKLTTTSLKGMLVASGIGALLVAITGVVSWLKRTETGAALLEKTMKVLGQVVIEGPVLAFKLLKDALTLNFKAMKGHVQEASNNIKASAALADELKAIEEDRRKSLKLTKELEESIAKNKEKLINTELTYNERKQAGANAIDDINKKYETEIELLERERIAKEKDLALDKDNLNKKLALEEVTNKLIEANTKLANERKEVSAQFRALDNEELSKADAKNKKLKELQDEFYLNTLTGREKDLAAAKVSYEKQVAENKGNYAILKQLHKNYIQEIGLINKQYNEEWTALLQKQRDEVAKIDKDVIDSTQTTQDAITKLLNDEWEQRNSDYEEVDTAKLEADAIRLDEANTMRLEKEQALKQGLLDIAQATSDAIFEINARNKQREYDDTMSKLDAEREREINNARGNKTKIAAINKKYDKEEEEIKKKKFKEDKRRQILEANMGISLAIIKAMPVLPQVIAVGIAGAAQLAVIASQKYARGGRVPEKKALGGPIVGYSHGMGGVQIEAEGGEYMINKEVMKNPVARSLVEEINSNGAPSIQELVQQEIQRTPMYTNLTEVNKENKKIQLREYGFTRKK